MLQPAGYADALQGEKMIETIGLISTFMAVVGVVLNNHLDARCFYLWFLSNLLCAWVHYRKRVWSLMIRDLIFMTLAIDGLIRWSK